MQKPHDNSKACPAAFVQDKTLVTVVEMSSSNWLAAGLVPGVDRQPSKKLGANPEDLLKQLYHKDLCSGGKKREGALRAAELLAVLPHACRQKRTTRDYTGVSSALRIYSLNPSDSQRAILLANGRSPAR
jgi:hypothetical protein